MKLALFLFPAVLCGQTFIDGVFPAEVPPGGFAEIDGFGFDGNAKVTVGGLNAPVYALSGNTSGEVSMFIQIPTTLPVGPTTLVLTQGEHVVNWTVTLVAAAPQFVSSYQPPYFPYIYPPAYRIERSLPAGGYGPWNCGKGDTPSSRELVRVYMAGLGATNPSVPAGTPAPESPLSFTVIQPTVKFGNTSAEVTESVLVPGEVGLYRVTFKIPDDFGFQTLSVTAGGITVTTPVGVGNAVASLYPAAPLSIQVATSCGGHFLSPGKTLMGDPGAPLTNLGDISVRVLDSRGGSKPAAILSATADQIEYVLPEGTASGTDDLYIAVGSVQWRGTIDVNRVAPRVFEVAPGIAAAYLIRVHNGEQTVEPVFRVSSDGSYSPAPIDLGREGDFVYLCVFGTGWRGRASLMDVALEYFNPDAGPALANTLNFRLSPIYAGAQGEFAGLDQADFLLPRGLTGTGNRYSNVTLLNVQGIRAPLRGLIYK